MKPYRLNQEDLLLDEALLFTGNGYIGIRGNFEEGYPKGYDTIRGTYINGFYEDVPIAYGESAHGFPKQAQKIVNVADAQTIQIHLDDGIFNLFEGEILHFERRLDIKLGLAIRIIEWRSPKGQEIKITIKRMTSFEQLELFLIDYCIESINYKGGIKIFSSLLGDVENYVNPNDPRVAGDHQHLLDVIQVSAKSNVGQVVMGTKSSNLGMAVTTGHTVDTTDQTFSLGVLNQYYAQIAPGDTLEFTKYCIYTDSRHHKDFLKAGKRLLASVMAKGTYAWFEAQEAYLERFWLKSRIRLEGDEQVEEALNYNIYQLLASAGKDGISNIAAKGLSGEGYEGHYFWDTEIYMMPLFTATMPKVAKALLAYRYSILESARHEARQLGHQKGVKIPWRTISGTECSAYFPAGSAQYHINADVAYALVQYYLMTDDFGIIEDFGFELLVETARLWLELGHFGLDGYFHIYGVTGPDEYTAFVNDNYYTNALAQYHLDWVLKFDAMLSDKAPYVRERLWRHLNLTDAEMQIMADAKAKMRLLFDQEKGIHPQDDSFLNKPLWDFKNTPKSMYPLLLHVHPMAIYRHQVLKQGDTVLAHLLLDDADDAVLKATYNYYEPLTTHDSSLSYCVYGMMAARNQDIKKAYDYFMKTIRLDLDNLHHNTKDGLHIANAGGAYMSIVYGFGGMRISEKGLVFRPIKPAQWPLLEFKILYRGHKIQITLDEAITFQVEKPVSLTIYNTCYQIKDTLILDYENH